MGVPTVLAPSGIRAILNGDGRRSIGRDRKSTRLNSSHSQISYAVFCLKKKKKEIVHRVRLVATETPDQRTIVTNKTANLDSVFLVLLTLNIDYRDHPSNHLQHAVYTD